MGDQEASKKNRRELQGDKRFRAFQAKGKSMSRENRGEHQEVAEFWKVMKGGKVGGRGQG